MCRFPHQALGQQVTGVGGLVNGPAGEVISRELAELARFVALGEGFVRAFHQRSGRGVGLEVSVGAAGALASVFHLDDDMPAFSTMAVSAFDDSALLNNAATNSCAQGEHDEA